MKDHFQATKGPFSSQHTMQLTKGPFSKGQFLSKHTMQLEVMKRSIQHAGTRFRINLLWKNNITMPNNYVAAKAQVESLQRRLQNDKLTMQLYKKIPINRF